MFNEMFSDLKSADDEGVEEATDKFLFYLVF